MKILVTGADGFLGTNLVLELLDRGHEVKAFIMPNRGYDPLKDLKVEKSYGNLLNAEEVNAAIAGGEVVIHTAALTDVWPSRSKIIRDVNIEGTQNVVNAVKANNVKRLVYVGTANSFGFGSKDDPGNETKPYRSAGYGLDYMDSKYEAQQLVLKEVKENNLPAVIVNPTFMFGPHDSKPGPGAMIIAVKKGKVPGYTKGGRNYVYVKDVAVAIANAIEMGKIGECYVAGNQNMTYKESFSKIAELVGGKTPKIAMPTFIVLLYGRIGSLIGNLSGKAPTVSYPMAKISSDQHFFTAAKAVEHLKMPQTPIDRAITEEYEWLKENGYL